MANGTAAAKAPGALCGKWERCFSIVKKCVFLYVKRETCVVFKGIYRGFGKFCMV